MPERFGNELSAYLSALYRASRESRFKELEKTAKQRGLKNAPSSESLRKYLAHQDLPQRPRWDTVADVVRLLAPFADRNEAAEVATAKRIFDSLYRPALEVHDTDPADASEHFAEIALASGRKLSGGLAMEGAAAISCFSAAQPFNPRVFSREFFDEFDILKETKLLRKDSQSLGENYERRPDSLHFHGPMQSARYPKSFISVDMYSFGVVSVYYGEDTTDYDSDEYIGHLAHGVWAMSLMIHAHLQSAGVAHAHFMGDRSHSQRALLDPPPRDDVWHWGYWAANEAMARLKQSLATDVSPIDPAAWDSGIPRAKLVNRQWDALDEKEAAKTRRWRRP